MSTYKVIQDVEAEDKLIWALSFRQFVYALIAAVFLYFTYLLIVKHVFFLIIFTLPVSLFTGFLAYPFGKDQPTEVWALSRLRFLLMPRNRIWAQSGVKELVTVTAPKKVDEDLTNGLSQAQVKSRLQALADTIDSRGWTVTTFQNPLTSDSDRLISSSALATASPQDQYTAEDILDVSSSPVAQKMDAMLIAETNKHRQELIDSLDRMREEKVVGAGSSTSEQHIDEELEEREEARHLPLNNMRTLKPVSSKAAAKETAKSTSTGDPDIISLAKRNDLNVDVIGHEINKARGSDPRSNKEVTISLH